MKKILKIHWLLALIGLCILSILSNIDSIQLEKVRGGDALSLDYYMPSFVRDTIFRLHEFPHWIPTYLGGMPFWANSENVVFSIWQIFYYIFPINVADLLNLRIIFTPVFAGFFMYLLAKELGLDSKASFIAGFIFMNNGMMRHWAYSWFSRADAMALVPLAFLLFYKAYKGKNWVLYSILCAFTLAYPIVNGGLVAFVFMALLFLLFYIFFLPGENFISRLTKLGLIAGVILIFILGFAAIKLLPLVEFGDISSKQFTYGYKDFVGQHYDVIGWNLNANDFFSAFSNSGVTDLKSFLLLPFEGEPYGLNPVNVGIMAMVLAIAAIVLLYKKKIVLMLIALAILTLLISAGFPIDFLIWKYVPVMDKLHHVHRSMFLFEFAIALLAGLGFSELMKRLDKFKQISKYQIVIFFVIITIITIELVIPDIYYEDRVPMDFSEQIKQNEMVQYYASQEPPFRVHNVNTYGVGGWASTVMAVKNQEMLYGTMNVWVPEYMNVYLGVGNSAGQAKYWGMLNTKYIYSKNPINLSGTTFFKKFTNCSICQEDSLMDQGISGPYVYTNDLYLPRAYYANNSILIFGGQAREFILQGLMPQKEFNPSNTVALIGDINSNDKITSVLLLEAPKENTKLLEYKAAGSKIYPDIFNSENKVTQSQFFNMLGNSSFSFIEAKHKLYTPNRQIIESSSFKGWLVLSEKFYLFSGWKAKQGNKDLKIYRANGINSAVYLDGSSEPIEFYYNSNSFNMGLTVTLATIVLAIIIIAYPYRKNISITKKSKTK